MTSTQSTDKTAEIDEYLPAVLQPAARPGAIQRLVTAPFRRERAARMQSR